MILLWMSAIANSRRMSGDRRKNFAQDAERFGDDYTCRSRFCVKLFAVSPADERHPHPGDGGGQALRLGMAQPQKNLGFMEI